MHWGGKLATKLLAEEYEKEEAHLGEEGGPTVDIKKTFG